MTLYLQGKSGNPEQFWNPCFAARSRHLCYRIFAAQCVCNFLVTLW